MQDNKNPAAGLGFDGRGTVCIDTKRVLDCCRDRDCYENSRVYLTEFGEETVAAATSVRTKTARTVCVNVGLEEVPFNCGFFRHFALIDTISDTLVNLTLMAGIWFRIKTLKH